MLDSAMACEKTKEELTAYLIESLGLEQVVPLLSEDVLLTKGPAVEILKKPQISKHGIRKLLGEMDLEKDVSDILSEVICESIGGATHLYQHQAEAFKQITNGKNILLPHPTGSGKTEAFLFPLLIEMFKSRSKGEEGVGVYMIYPMKSLENDQRDRLKRILFSLSQKTKHLVPKMAVLDGDTPRLSDWSKEGQERSRLEFHRETCPSCGENYLTYNREEPHLLQCKVGFSTGDEWINRGCGYPGNLGISWIRTYRDDIQKQRPEFLITNPEALDYQLLSPKSNSLFSTKKRKVFFVVDEAHAYSSGSLLSLRVLLRRLEEKIRMASPGNVEFQYIISSATLATPLEFGKSVVPWKDFEAIPFYEKKVAFPPERKKLKEELEMPQIKEISNVFEVLTFEQTIFTEEETKKVQKLCLALEIFKIGEHGIEPQTQDIMEAYELYLQDSNGQKEASKILKEKMKETFLKYEIVQGLFFELSSGPVLLDEIIATAKNRWGLNGDAKKTVYTLIQLGRVLGVWEDKWHYMVRTVTGLVGCSGKNTHVRHKSEKESTPGKCTKCNSLQFELLTCNGCSKPFYLSPYCPHCDSLFHPLTGCACPQTKEDVENMPLMFRLVDLESFKGKTFPLKAAEGDMPIEYEEGKKSTCHACGKDIRKIRRRTDMLIGVTITRLGSEIPDDHKRKMLIFSDSRAASERLTRDFRRTQILIRAERSILSALENALKLEGKNSLPVSYIKDQAMNMTYSPYHVLRGILRKEEWKKWEKFIAKAVFTSIGTGVYDNDFRTSRLMRYGLVGFKLKDDGKISPVKEFLLSRLIDELTKSGANGDKGVKITTAKEKFMSKNAEFSTYLMGIMLSEDLNFEELVEYLESIDCIKNISLKDKNYLCFNRENEKRELFIPSEVKVCNDCKNVYWYPSELCDTCGENTKTLSRKQLKERFDIVKTIMSNNYSLVSSVHRGALSSQERQRIERAFKNEGKINAIFTTPTLELGIDVGMLSYIFLSGIPPTRNSYIQRVGRAGRTPQSGSACISFTYPNPVDSFYFRNPKRLLCLELEKVPCRSLNHQTIMPFLWSSFIDSFSYYGGPATQYISPSYELGIRDMYENLPAIQDGAKYSWEKIKGHLSSIISDITKSPNDSLSPAEITDMLTKTHQQIADTEEFSILLKKDVYEEIEKDLIKRKKRLHKDISELDGISKEDKIAERNIQRELEEVERFMEEYQSTPVIMHLHSFGVLSSQRMIGSTVEVFDEKGRYIDSRDEQMSSLEYFPGSYIYRQGNPYKIFRVIYNPIIKRIIYCPECHILLDKEENCPNDAFHKVIITEIKTPLVAYAKRAIIDVETVATGEQYIRPLDFSEKRNRIPGSTIRISDLTGVEVCSLTEKYDEYSSKRSAKKDVQISRCSVCGDNFSKNSKCCISPEEELIVQGRIYQTNAICVEMDLEINQLELPEFKELNKEERRLTLCHSLRVGIHNALGIVNDVSPDSFITCIGREGLDSPSSIWVLEPVEGGSGLLRGMTNDDWKKVFDTLMRLISDSPEHSCEKYCDQCLIVPRGETGHYEYLDRTALRKVLL